MINHQASRGDLLASDQAGHSFNLVIGDCPRPDTDVRRADLTEDVQHHVEHAELAAGYGEKGHILLDGSNGLGCAVERFHRAVAPASVHAGVPLVGVSGIGYYTLLCVQVQ